MAATNVQRFSGDVILSGNMNLQKVSNTATIKLDSNVVTEFNRSKKLIKYPRVALNSASQDGYVVTASTDAYDNTFFHRYDPFRPFVSGSANGWHSGPPHTSTVNLWDQTFDTSGYNKDITSYGAGGYAGTSIAEIESEWLKLELPHKIVLSHFFYQQRDGASVNYHQAPKDFRILGSNDDIDWDTIKIFTGQTSNPEGQTLTAEATKGYKYLAFVVTATQTPTGTSGLTLKNLEYYGVPEYDPDAHGTDVTVKSYPNVPNTDWLEVYYDGQDYTQTSDFVGLGGVVDKAGGDQDGTAGTGVTFDSTYKAFVFDGSADGKITGTHGLGTGTGITPTISLWFRMNDTSTNRFFVIGDQGPTNTSRQSITVGHHQGFVYLDYWYSEVQTSSTAVIPGVWYHLAIVHKGPGTTATGSQDIYLNNVKQTLKLHASNNSNSTLDLQGTGLTIGADPSGTTPLTGSIANFRLFNRPLTSDEIYQLYAYQKEDFGHGDLSMTLKAGRLGIGTSEPRAALDVRGDIHLFPQGYVELNQGNRPVDYAATHGMRWTNTDNSNHWHLFNSNNDHFRFVYNGQAKGWVDPNDPNVQMNFTGQHRTFIKDVPFSQAGHLEGLIVSSDQNKYIKMSDGIEAGSNAITVNESLPIVSLSNAVTDKKCFGVISASEDPENRTEQYGAFGTNFEKEKGDTRVYINSVGEGAIWVVNTNGSLESGDYITTSNVTGYGQKQESEFLANYTVAKITMDCDFNPATQSIQIIKKDEEDENVLDEHGQIQWEDHPTETEKAYKVRYLTADGAQTDEANTVHIAAFVGCTYHCG